MPELDLHPEHDGIRYTLRGLFRDEADAAKAAGKVAAKGIKILRLDLESPGGTKLHAVAGVHDVQKKVRTGLPHKKTVDVLAVAIAASFFRLLVRAASGAGRKTRWYKHFDVESLRRCMASYEWQGTIEEVAAGILSDTILAHPFPNVNHRTSLTIMRDYLESVGITWPRYSLKGQGIKRFILDTRRFFKESKYLLQVLRRAPMLRVALEEGYTHVRIGPDTVAEMHREDLDLDSREIRARHKAACRKLVNDIASEEDRAHLGHPNKSTLRDWVGWRNARRGSSPASAKKPRPSRARKPAGDH